MSDKSIRILPESGN